LTIKKNKNIFSGVKWSQREIKLLQIK
jgi:hypothetical protein